MVLETWDASTEHYWNLGHACGRLEAYEGVGTGERLDERQRFWWRVSVVSHVRRCSPPGAYRLLDLIRLLAVPKVPKRSVVILNLNLARAFNFAILDYQLSWTSL